MNSAVHLEGRPLATFDQINCTTPRGIHDLKIYPSQILLHGKTIDYNIPIKAIARLFLLPHKDERHIFFVVSLDPAIFQGETNNHFLVLEFQKDQVGPTCDIFSKLMRALVTQKIIVPINFTGNSGTSAIDCGYKSNSGTLYPLEKGFMYIHNPPMYIRFEEISYVNFAQSNVRVTSFEFEIVKKGQTTITFNSIEKEEYSCLFDFVNQKGLRLKKASKKLVDCAGSSDNVVYPNKKTKKKTHLTYNRKGNRVLQPDESEFDSDYDPEQLEEMKERGSDPDGEYDSGAEQISQDDDEEGKAPKKKKKRRDNSGDEGTSSPSKTRRNNGSSASGVGKNQKSFKAKNIEKKKFKKKNPNIDVLMGTPEKCEKCGNEGFKRDYTVAYNIKNGERELTKSRRHGCYRCSAKHCRHNNGFILVAKTNEWSSDENEVESADKLVVKMQIEKTNLIEKFEAQVQSINQLEMEKARMKLENETLVEVKTRVCAENARLKEEIQRAQNAHKCVICTATSIQVAFVPCGHMTCQPCACRCVRCPFCTTKIDKLLKIYNP